MYKHTRKLARYPGHFIQWLGRISTICTNFCVYIYIYICVRIYTKIKSLFHLLVTMTICTMTGYLSSKISTCVKLGSGDHSSYAKKRCIVMDIFTHMKEHVWKSACHSIYDVKWHGRISNRRREGYHWFASVGLFGFFDRYDQTVQHIATHCNTLQRTATHCNTLQQTATQCSTLLHNMNLLLLSFLDFLIDIGTHYNTL